MSSIEGTRVTRTGGWAALGVAACGVVRLFLAAQVHVPASGAKLAPSDGGWDLALAGVGAAAALSQIAAVQGVRVRLAPDTRLLWTASGAGWAGAALALTGFVVTGARAVAGTGAPFATGLLLGWLAAFATALWVAGVCAADWRLLRLPAWLRVVGTTYAVFSLVAAVLTPVVLLALPFALFWWIGLGVVLLRAPRSTPG